MSQPPLKFAKASEIILAKLPESFTVKDLCLKNWLFFTTITKSASIQSQSHPGVYEVPVEGAMEWMNESHHSRLIASLKRLATANVHIDMKGEDGTTRTIMGHVLSVDVTESRNGRIRYAFDPLMQEVMWRPKVYANLDLSVWNNMDSYYAKRLYEIMSLHSRRHHPVWEPTVEHLQAQLPIKQSYHGRIDNIKTRILEPAIEEINTKSDLRVEAEYKREGRGGKINRIRFTVIPKLAHSRFSNVGATQPIGKGRISTDSGTLALPLVDTGTEISRDAMAEAKTYIEGNTDMDLLVEQWRIAMAGRRIRQPDQSFIQWVIFHHGRNEDDDLSDVSDEAMAAILSEWEHGS